MSESANVVLLVDPDARARAHLAEQLRTLGCTIIEADDGPAAMRLLEQRDVKLVVTELYLETEGERDLICAIRRVKSLRKTRTMAHTHRSLAADRDWAMRAGADAYLIKPTRAERVRYVVGRLTTTRGPNASVASQRAPHAIARRDSLGVALSDIEKGTLGGTTDIVFGRDWWEHLSRAERSVYRKRAKQARVSLRSDSLIGSHFVEVRGPSRDDIGLSTERPESPYRR